MDDTSAMGVAETRHRLRYDGKALLQAEPAHLRQEIVKGVAAHQLHDHEGVLAFELKRIERRDIGVVQIGEALRLDVEAVDQIAVAAQLGPQRLDRDLPSEQRVLRGIDLTNAALAEQPLNLIWTDPARGYVSYRQSKVSRMRHPTIEQSAGRQSYQRSAANG